MKNVEDMKNINFMVERLTEDAGKAFSPAKTQAEEGKL